MQAHWAVNHCGKTVQHYQHCARAYAPNRHRNDPDVVWPVANQTKNSLHFLLRSMSLFVVCHLRGFLQPRPLFPISWPVRRLRVVSIMPTRLDFPLLLDCPQWRIAALKSSVPAPIELDATRPFRSSWHPRQAISSRLYVPYNTDDDIPPTEGASHDVITTRLELCRASKSVIHPQLFQRPTTTR